MLIDARIRSLGIMNIGHFTIHYNKATIHYSFNLKLKGQKIHPQLDTQSKV